MNDIELNPDIARKMLGPSASNLSDDEVIDAIIDKASEYELNVTVDEEDD